MTVRKATFIETYNLWTGVGGSYDRTASYDDPEELWRDARAELAAGRQVLIEPEPVRESEWEARPVVSGLAFKKGRVTAGTPTGKEEGL